MDLQTITEKLDTAFKPFSVILYGSRARTDFMPHSDYEIAVFFKREKLVPWAEIKKVVDEKGVNIYPYVYEDFLKANFDTPFQKNIYQRELVVAGKTISGEKVIEQMLPQPIKIIDALEDIRFHSGRALNAVLSHRHGDKITAALTFAKVCLFATRDLIMLQSGQFPTTYDDILTVSKKCDLDRYANVVENAFEVRQRRRNIREADHIDNITYINYFIEPQLKDAYDKNKELILVQ
ncbi:MAG: hypothetical protein AABX16_02385 [Nanoarchaeota archaeon]